MEEWRHLKADLDELTRRALSRRMFPEGYVLHEPVFGQGELAFLRCVTWLYVHYYELARPHIKFLASDIASAGERTKEHFLLVRWLRTYSQHALHPARDADQTALLACQAWFQLACGTAAPNRAARHWSACVCTLMRQSLEFMLTIRSCASRIVDEDDEIALQGWRFKATHYCAPWDYDEIIRRAARKLGCSVDVPAFRNAHYESWNRRLAIMPENFDFTAEATRLAEYSLVSEPVLRLPLSGDDVMVSFSIPEGPEVGDLLVLAKQLYLERRCSGEELLERLHEAVGRTDATPLPASPRPLKSLAARRV